MFWVHKRNVSMRRFFYVPKNKCLIGKELIIIILGVYIIYVYLPIIRTTENSKYNLWSPGLQFMRLDCILASQGLKEKPLWM